MVLQEIAGLSFCFSISQTAGNFNPVGEFMAIGRGENAETFNLNCNITVIYTYRSSICTF